MCFRLQGRAFSEGFALPLWGPHLRAQCSSCNLTPGGPGVGRREGQAVLSAAGVSGQPGFPAERSGLRHLDRNATGKPEAGQSGGPETLPPSRRRHWH